MKNILAIFILSMSLISCSNKSSETFKSSNDSKTLEITISANQTVMFDPWKATITVHNLKTGSFNTVEQELVIDGLDESNLKFDWVSDNKCLIRFTEKNGEVRTVPVIIQV